MIISRIGAQGARGYVVEFVGSAINALSIEARFTLCNMTVEAGARGALIAPDQCAIDYVLSIARDIVGNIQEKAISHWAKQVSDDDAVFACEYSIYADKVAPYVDRKSKRVNYS